MEIDLFTLIAQVINLIILLFLLRKFLYLPVLKAIEARQAVIDEELSAATQARKKAEQTAAKCDQELKDIAIHKQEVMSKIQSEADKFSAELSVEALKQYEISKQKWQDKLAAEKDNYVSGLQKSVAESFSRFAQKAMEQMAGSSLDDLVIKQFMAKLSDLSEEQKKEYAKTFGSQKKFLIQSAFAISAEVKDELEKMLRQEWNLDDKTVFSYEVNGNLISGISLQAGEQLIDWSFQKYLDEFKNNVSREVFLLLNRGEK